jgi:hypothetical protein
MNNQLLAKAVAALFALMNEDNWTPTDDALNDAALKLWEAADCHRWEFAGMLIQEGVEVDSAIALCDVPNYEWSLVQQFADAVPELSETDRRLMVGIFGKVPS